MLPYYKMRTFINTFIIFILEDVLIDKEVLGVKRIGKIASFFIK